MSIFFPAYNDAGTIASLVESSLRILPTLADDFEVIVVNDGSTDATAAVLAQLAAAHAQVRIINHLWNRGYGGALRSGFHAAQKELIFYTDGDGQYDVEDLTLLCAALRPDVDVVNGYKRARADGKTRKVLGGIYNQFVRLLFDIPVRDVDCDFRLVRRSAIEKISLTANGGAICAELIHKLHHAGGRFAEIPVRHYPRMFGRSQFFRLRPLARSASELIRLWWVMVVWPNVSHSPAAESEPRVAAVRK